MPAALAFINELKEVDKLDPTFDAEQAIILTKDLSNEKIALLTRELLATVGVGVDVQITNELFHKTWRQLFWAPELDADAATAATDLVFYSMDVAVFFSLSCLSIEHSPNRRALCRAIAKWGTRTSSSSDAWPLWLWQDSSC